MRWKLISQKSLDQLKSWAEANNVLDSLLALGIQVADYEGESFRLDIDPPMLPCNCLARERNDPNLAGWHSSECAHVYEDTPEGIAGYEEWTGRPYVRAELAWLAVQTEGVR